MFLRTMSLMATVCVISLNSLPSFANPIPDNSLAQMPAMEGPPKTERLMQKLNLTTEQQQKIREIRSKYQGQISQQMTQLRTERQKLNDLMKTNASNEAIRDQHEEMVKVREKLEDLHFESMLEMRTVLTSEQRVQFADMMGNKPHKFRAGSGGWK